jgi:hypothetical protein
MGLCLRILKPLLKSAGAPNLSPILFGTYFILCLKSFAKLLIVIAQPVPNVYSELVFFLDAK